MNNERANKLRELVYRFGHKRGRIIDTGAQKCNKMRVHDVMILKAIKETGEGKPIKMTQLAQYLKISAPAVSQISRRLENSGYIERTIIDEDRRSVYIQVSKQAKDEMKKAESHFNRSLDDIQTYLGEEDTDELIRILEKILLYFDEQERK